MKEAVLMNYGKQKASQKQKDITSKSTMRKKRIGVRLFKAFLICFLVLCISGAVAGGLLIKKIIDNAPEITPASIKPKGYISTIYADDGITETESLQAAGSNRVYKTIDEIPKDLQHAFVAIEDSRFYTHKGIDPQVNPNVQIILTTHSPAVIMNGWLDAVTEVSDITIR